MTRRKPMLNGIVIIPEGFASEADEALFWESVEFSDEFWKHGPQPPADLIVPIEDRDEGALPASELRAWRRRLGLTQRELAAALGLPRATIAGWERGQDPVTPARMVRMALERLDQLNGHVKAVESE